MVFPFLLLLERKRIVQKPPQSSPYVSLARTESYVHTQTYHWQRGSELVQTNCDSNPGTGHQEERGSSINIDKWWCLLHQKGFKMKNADVFNYQFQCNLIITESVQWARQKNAHVSFFLSSWSYVQERLYRGFLREPLKDLTFWNFKAVLVLNTNPYYNLSSKEIFLN